MLILVFRGIFLIGILSWYSTNVWKMIDGYFKEQFEKYLQREYQKNPKMRDHVEAHKTSGEDNEKSKIAESIVETTKESYLSHEQESCKGLGDLGEEICLIDSSVMEKMAGGDRAGSRSFSSGLPSKEGEWIDDCGTGEREVSAKGASDNGAVAKSPTDTFVTNVIEKLPIKDDGVTSFTKKKSVKSSLTAVEIKAIVDDSDGNVTSGNSTIASDDSRVTMTNFNDPEASNIVKEPTKRKSKRKKKQLVRKKVEEAKDPKGKKKKIRVKTIVFTKDDFKKAKIRGGLQDYDFSEFDGEYEDDSYEPPEGILVSQLPFKPRADIGSLERVSDDEFCPLTIEDEANCDEITTWP